MNRRMAQNVKRGMGEERRGGIRKKEEKEREDEEEGIGQ